MEIWEVILTVIISIIGSGGVLTIYLKHRLDKAEKKADKARQRRLDMHKYEREMWSATGRALFWIKRANEKHEPLNGEYAKAYEEFSEAEHKCKELEREIAAEDIE